MLNKGENRIDVFFNSPIMQVKGKKDFYAAFTAERIHTRRKQCSYGWDWTMRFVSCGISKNVYINQYEGNEPRVNNVYIYTKNVDFMGASVGINVEFFKDSVDRVYTFDIYDNDGKKVKSHKKHCPYFKYNFNLSIEGAKLWYPAGYGEQPLYELRISCEENVIYSEKFGIRTVRIIQEIDEENSENYKKCIELKKSNFALHYDNNKEFSGFTLVVNGIKILCQGANWVPCEPFETGDVSEKITDILELSKEMGVNMIRVWGGGSFEQKHFYEECSRLGIMVTQDFLMACGVYPEKEEWFVKHLNNEASYAAKLIRNQPCLMWWSGDNENATLGTDILEDHVGKASACFGIQPVLMELDPERDFFPSSPYGGDYYASNTVGTTHNTQYLGGIFEAIENIPLDDYKQRFKKLCARFIAEEPTFGMASTHSMLKFMTKEDIYGEDSSIMRYHTKSNPGLKTELYDYSCMLTRKILGDFKDGYDRTFKLKYMQYENVRLSLEQLRREKWFCSGVIFWMLEDCWPAGAGWAFIDYYCKPKASFYSFKRCSKSVICSVDKVNDKYNVYVCNDGIKDDKVLVSVFALNVKNGKKEEFYSGETFACAGKTEIVYSFSRDFGADWVVFAEISGELGKDRAFYKDGTLFVDKTDVEYNVCEKNNSITFKADGEYVHAVEIEGNLILEDNYFSLLPGETKTVTYRKHNEKLPLDVEIVAYTL